MSALLAVQASVMQVSNKLRAAEEQMHKMQGVISTEAEAENCLSGLLEQMHRRVYSLVHATPEVAAGDHKTKELHIAPRVNEMLKEYIVEVTSDTLYLSQSHALLLPTDYNAFFIISFHSASFGPD